MKPDKQVKFKWGSTILVDRVAFWMENLTVILAWVMVHSPVDTLLCYCSLIGLMDRRLIWRVLEGAARGQEATSLLACKVSSIGWVSGWCGIKLHTLQSSPFLLVCNETVVRSALIPNCFPLSHLSCFCCMLGYIWVQLHHNHSCLGSN